MTETSFQLWFRLRSPKGAIGPGKVRLLEAVRETGSLSAAARTQGMSYRRAWQLVDDARTAAGCALIATTQGGRGGGGASLTAAGAQLVDEYRRLEAAMNALAHDALARIDALNEEG
ncbi:winged helix-turn-helix domain-containing protein [Brevundimonas sp.]|uniref:winged helix-turn-helix domain-containing protein n=1 Tax=Brevundimonas sp. TaxID=1871086 RepID=UPI00289AB94A|nr:LysR family transcriptional regulator [Brevundimonas sp.]